jgi:hypothetical protein
LSNKSIAGLLGAIAVLILLIVQSIERWSVVAALIDGLRASGPFGSFIAGILLSRLSALVLAVAAIYLVWGERKDKKEAALTPSSSPIMQSVNTGSVTQHFEPHITIGSEKPEVPQAKEEIPSLRYVQTRQICLSEDSRSVWQEVSSSQINGIVADFRNVPKHAGQTTVTAKSVTAKLVFRSPGLEELHVNHGTWLKHYTHFATLQSGDTHSLVIAIKLIPFVTLENPRSQDPFAARRWRSGITIYPVNKIALSTSGDLEISLVDTWGVTVFHGLFEYRLATDNMQLIPKPGE